MKNYSFLQEMNKITAMGKSLKKVGNSGIGRKVGLVAGFPFPLGDEILGAAGNSLDKLAKKAGNGLRYKALEKHFGPKKLKRLLKK